MVSLAIVVAFILLMILSATGLDRHATGRSETGVNYAPPSFIGADIEGGRAGGAGRRRTGGADARQHVQVDGRRSARRRACRDCKGRRRGAAAGSESKSVDPLADVMGDRGAQAATGARRRTSTRWPT